MKKHLCKTCGETDPDKFRMKRKEKCKSCTYSDQKKWRKDNSEHVSNYFKKWRKDNADHASEYDKKWREVNHDHRNEYDKKYKKEKKEKDPSFKFLCAIRSRQGDVLRGRQSTTKGLGCSRQELLDHLESLFQKGMTHENHGEWHIDHILPLSSHDKDQDGNWCTESEYNKQLIHYINLQPLWAEDNIKKSNKVFSNN